MYDDDGFWHIASVSAVQRHVWSWRKAGKTTVKIALMSGPWPCSVVRDRLGPFVAQPPYRKVLSSIRVRVFFWGSLRRREFERVFARLG
jgi:hypothetical protein